MTNYVNKGNYSLETPAREAEFERRRAHGWEPAYRAYRQEWLARVEKRRFGEWPLLVDMELSSICNLHCPMCYTNTRTFKNTVDRQFMPVQLFRDIVDEIAAHVPALRLSFRGESTLHPQFLDCLAYAKQKGIGEVSFLTNASRLDKTFIHKIIMAGADWITVSLDGLHEIYENIRKPLRFEETVEKLKFLRASRERLCKVRPVVKVQSVWPAIAKDPLAYYNYLSPLVDFVAFNPLVDYLEVDSLDSIIYVPDFYCPMLHQRLVITSDGMALPCSNDSKEGLSLGSVKSRSVYDIWNSETLRALREAHARCDGFKQYSPCRHCYLPRATTDSFVPLADGRRIIVKNYLNRVQSIGK